MLVLFETSAGYALFKVLFLVRYFSRYFFYELAVPFRRVLVDSADLSILGCCPGLWLVGVVCIL